MKKIIFSCLLLLFVNSLKSQGDCTTLCITADGTYNAASSVTDELTLTNRGCIASNEASFSYWFQVCFSTTGIFAFNLDPANQRNDYDFAVWNGINCPPTTAPVRCSWAAVSPGGPCATCDSTGMGSQATDFTEGAGGDGWVAPLSVTAGDCITISINNYGSGSQQFDLAFDGTTATMTCLPLPIELLLFDAQSLGKKTVHLSWQTATELNNDYFTIERSLDAVSFESVAVINGAGNSTASSSYLTKDSTPFIGTSYYRLKQTDYNGNFSYSALKEVTVVDEDVDLNFSILPNPSNKTESSTINFSGNPFEEVIVSMYDVAGRIVLKEQVVLSSNGTYSMLLNNNVEVGMYFVNAISETGNLYNQKYIVKQKR